MQDEKDLAREAAKRLAPKYGTDLTLEVEKAIQGGTKPGQYVTVGDAAAVAAVIVSVATLAWQIWHDTRTRGNKDDVETIKRELRLKLPAPKGIDTPTRDEIIITIVDELPKN